MPRTAVEVKNLTKIFKVPHKKRDDTLRGAFVNFKDHFFARKDYEILKALDNVSF
ncbi:MAG: hypothetical protein GF347_01600, partial [Candidatus Moranbacteria bacterium]|nr:hypothetical protein [Candidatus Moranbacteria bacterium]